MTLDEPFSTAAPVLLNFSFTEVIEGTSSIIFYAGSANDETATEDSILKSTTFASESIEKDTLSASLSQTFVLKQEINYDLTIATTTQTLKGMAIVEIGWAVKGHASADIIGHIIVDLIVDDGSETIVGTGQTTDLTNPGGATYDITRSTLKLVLTETQLKRGDTLRLSVKGYLKNSTGSFGGNIRWGQDPLNRDGTQIKPSTTDTITALKVTTPFKT